MSALSARLEAILSLLSPCQRLVDVGTDHGIVPISAVQRGIAKHAIASDLRRAPLQVAQQNITRAAVSDRVSLVREDGLSALAPHSVDAVVMAGMSGQLMVRICSAAPHVLAGVAQLVTQPNSGAKLMRAWALHHGFHLRDERMLIERDQFFVTCAFVRADGADPAYQLASFSEEALCLLGPLLLRTKQPAALRYSEWQCARLGALSARGIPTQLAELAIWQAASAFMRTTQ